jgi:Uma2 family endonuclease
MAVAQQPRRWTREEYDRMVEAGILGPEDRVELIEGEILTMSPQKSPHATGVQLAGDVLQEVFGQGFVVRRQLPLALAADSEPEPDVAVVEGRPRDYRDAHPSTAILIVEVAETSLIYDRTIKKALYAAAGIPEYWIVNLTGGGLEVYREPLGSDYRSRLILRPDETVSPRVRPEARILAADLLP